MPGFFSVPALNLGTAIEVARYPMTQAEYDALPPEDNNIYDFTTKPERDIPPSDDCANSKFPYLCNASKNARNIFQQNFTNPFSTAIDNATNKAEDTGLRVGLGLLGILTVVAGFYILAGKGVINVISGGTGKTGDAVSNVKTIAKKGVTLAVTKNPAAAAAV